MKENIDNQQFNWFQCPFVLRRIRNNNVQFLSLRPEVQIQDQNFQKQQIQIGVQLQKLFTYDDQLGFTWHKSWIIPQIAINTNIPQLNDGSQLRIICEITSGYPTPQSEAYYFHQVRIDGENHKRLVNNQVKFTNLKFTSTSFNNDGNKFSLIVILYLQQYDSLKILKSNISSSIYIDSRKEARTKKQTITKIQEIINPSKFSEPIILKRKQDEFIVQNDLDGFLQYYSSPNIRNKIKHPFFICYKFDCCFTLYYSIKQTKKTNITNALLTAIKEQKKNVILIYTPYISHEIKKRVMTIFDNWRINFISLVFDKQLIPKNFQYLNSEQLLSIYTQYFKNVQKINKMHKKNIEYSKSEVITTQILIQSSSNNRLK